MTKNPELAEQAWLAAYNHGYLRALHTEDANPSDQGGWFYDARPELLEAYRQGFEVGRLERRQGHCPAVAVAANHALKRRP